MTKAAVFDLDGVLVRTDQAHDKAWRALAVRLGIPFDGRAAARLRGVSRMEALDIVLEGCGRSFTPAEKEALAAEKNERYRALIAEMTPADVAPDTTVTLKALRERGLLLAVASSSKNARFILERTGLTPYFHAVVDGTQIARSKPDPEVFLKAAQALGVSPAEALVVEDAAAGVRTARCGGFSSAALGHAGIVVVFGHEGVKILAGGQLGHHFFGLGLGGSLVLLLQLFKFRQQRGRLKRGSGIRIEEFVRRDAEVFTDVEKGLHGGK